MKIAHNRSPLGTRRVEPNSLFLNVNCQVATKCKKTARMLVCTRPVVHCVSVPRRVASPARQTASFKRPDTPETSYKRRFSRGGGNEAGGTPPHPPSLSQLTCTEMQRKTLLHPTQLDANSHTEVSFRVSAPRGHVFCCAITCRDM